MFIILDVVWRLPLVALVVAAILSVVFFPWSSDSPLSSSEQKDLQNYYATAYEKQGAAAEKEDSIYVNIAEEAARKVDVTGHVTEFAADFALQGRKVLDIGAGRGYLQDVVSDYTALDISPSAKRFFHKPFVLASATLMPFQADEFDAAWTIWVLEHVPNPEAALAEMRRVVKDGGLIYLAPAWDCRPWAAEGYPVRPYNDFGFGGKLIKASLPVTSYLWNMSKPATRLVRYLGWRSNGGPTRFHYRRLSPNYDRYWMSDSDAVNSLDRYETALWFLSRGDECLNCQGALHGLLQENEALILRIHKALPAVKSPAAGKRQLSLLQSLGTPSVATLHVR